MGGSWLDVCLWRGLRVGEYCWVVVFDEKSVRVSGMMGCVDV